MKSWKLVSGILCIVLCVIVLFQSCAAGLANALEENGDSGGTAGLLVALLLLAGGVTAIATRNSREKGGSVALVILFGLAAVLAFSNAAVYQDLTVWAVWCVINAGMAVIALVKA